MSDTPIQLGRAELRQIWPTRSSGNPVVVEGPSPAKWPQWKTWSVAIGSSLLLWAVLIALVAAVIG